MYHRAVCTLCWCLCVDKLLIAVITDSTQPFSMKHLWTMLTYSAILGFWVLGAFQPQPLEYACACARGSNSRRHTTCAPISRAARATAVHAYRVDVGIMGRLLLWVKHFLGHHKTCGSNYSVLRLSFIMEWWKLPCNTNIQLIIKEVLNKLLKMRVFYWSNSRWLYK